MKISSSRGLLNIGGGSLLGIYNQQAQAANQPRGITSQDPQVTASQLKSQLLSLADRLSPFAKLSGSFGGGSGGFTQVTTGSTNGSTSGSGSASGGGSTTGSGSVDAGSGGDTPPPAAPDRVSLSFSGGGRKPIKFAREINRALTRGVKDGDEELLRGKNVRGEVKVDIGEGENKRSFSIRVDENTTANDFVQEFNSKAGGRAEAKLQEVGRRGRGRDGDGNEGRGDSRFRIAIETKAAAVPPPPPPVENEDEEDVQEPVESDDSSAPGTRTELIGSIGLSNLSTLDAQNVKKDLKGFVNEFNRLVKLSESGNDGSNVLASTSVDERAIVEIRNAIESSSAKGGTVSVADLFSKGSGGTLRLNEQSVDRILEEDPDGLVTALRDLAETVQGRDGVVQQYTGRANLVDRSIANVQAQISQGAVASPVSSTDTKSEQVNRFQEAAPTIANVVGSRIRSVA